MSKKEGAAAAEGFEQVRLLQDMMMFAALGRYGEEVEVESTTAHASSGHCMHDLVVMGFARLKHIRREVALADVMRHPPGARSWSSSRQGLASGVSMSRHRRWQRSAITSP